jgi:ribosomal protein L16 Arg81 hydroxylase
VEVFFSDYWERKPLVIRRAQPNYYDSLLSLDDIDRVITTVARQYPDVILKNANAEVTVDDYTVRGDSFDVARIYQLFERGSTITLSYLDTVIPVIGHFCRNLEHEFSCPFQANAYMTPAGAQGARPHYDTHDVFVLQVVNSKDWTTYGTPVELPLRGQTFDASTHERGGPTLEFKLNAGDMAYIPRGVVHDARSAESMSLHLTVGILSYTWTDLLLEFVADKSLSKSAFRKSVPPGFARQEFDRHQALQTLRGLLHALSEEPDLNPILDRFVEEFISACPPLLRGQMAQIALLDRLTVFSVVGARAGVISRLRTNGDATLVDCYGRTITFPSHASAALRFALCNLQFVVRELPGDLDDEGKLTLVRRLVREGLVLVLST